MAVRAEIQSKPTTQCKRVRGARRHKAGSSRVARQPASRLYSLSCRAGSCRRGPQTRAGVDASGAQCGLSHSLDKASAEGSRHVTSTRDRGDGHVTPSPRNLHLSLWGWGGISAGHAVTGHPPSPMSPPIWLTCLFEITL